MRVRFVSHQFGAFGPKLRKLDRNWAIVVVPGGCPQPIRVEQLFAQFTHFRLGHKGLKRGTIQTNDPGASLLVPDRGFECFAEPGSLRLVSQFQLESISGFKQVLAEASRQFGNLRVDVGDLVLYLRRQRRTGTNKFPMLQFEQPGILLVQPEVVLLLINRLNSSEQLAVQRDCIVLAREHGVDLRLQRAQFVIRVRAVDISERCGHPLQHLPGHFQCLHRVLKRRLIVILNDFPNLSPQFENAFLDRRHVVAVLDLGKRRHTVRPVPLLQEWIVGQFSFGHGDVGNRRAHVCALRIAGLFTGAKGCDCNKHAA